MIKVGSRNAAIVIAYLTILLNMLSLLLLTPFYINRLGVDSYGLYQLMFSVAQYVFVLEFGISTVMTRYILQYRLQSDNRAAENFAMHCFLIVIVIVLIIIFAGVVLSANLMSIFPNLNPADLPVARTLFNFMIVQIVLTVLSQYYQGIAFAFEEYMLVKGVALLRIPIKAIGAFAFIICGAGVLGIVFADVLAAAFCFLSFAFCSKFKLHFSAKWHFFDKSAITDALPLMAALLLQSLVTYANNALDMTILGRMMDTTAVAIYAIAMTFISVFSAMPTAIQSVYLPEATKLVVKNADGEQFTDLVIAPGRVQFMLCAAMLSGFVLFGRQFITIWTGAATLGAWWVALIIMVPMMFPLIQNVCLTILTAQNKRTFRSTVLLGITLLNLVLTVFLVHRFGLLGAPVGTALSYFTGNIVIMNIYYHKKIGLNVRRMFGEIFRGTAKCAFVATLLCLPLLMAPFEGVLWFLLECGIFCVVYAALLYNFGVNKKERDYISSFIEGVHHA
jgi:O-antigen/teichoic acid export membrane protein